MKHLSYHPAALEELAEAVTFYFESASDEVASKFDAMVERGSVDIRNAPLRYPCWKKSRARKYIVPKFPYVIFYLDSREHIRILAVAHTSRRPGYWKSRIAVD